MGRLLSVGVEIIADCCVDPKLGEEDFSVTPTRLQSPMTEGGHIMKIIYEKNSVQIDITTNIISHWNRSTHIL